MDEEIEAVKKENKKLRELLWLNHGCPIGMLYGDDGEMQCNKCMIDFKRDSIEDIINKFAKMGVLEYQKEIERAKK